MASVHVDAVPMNINFDRVLDVKVSIYTKAGNRDLSKHYATVIQPPDFLIDIYINSDGKIYEIRESKIEMKKGFICGSSETFDEPVAVLIKKWDALGDLLAKYYITENYWNNEIQKDLTCYGISIPYNATINQYVVTDDVQFNNTLKKRPIKPIGPGKPIHPRPVHPKPVKPEPVRPEPFKAVPTPPVTPKPKPIAEPEKKKDNTILWLIFGALLVFIFMKKR